MPSKSRAVLYIILANVIWASVGFLVRLTTVSQITFLFWVGIFGLLGSIGKMAVMGDLRTIKQLEWRPTNWAYMVFNGGLGICIFLAYQDDRVFVAVPNLILNSVVLLVVLLAPLMIKEKTTRKEMILACMGFVGLAVFVIGQSIGALDPSAQLFSIGVLFSLIALLFNGLSSVLSRLFAQRMPATAVTLYVSLGDILVSLVVAGILGVNIFSISAVDLGLATVMGLSSVTICYHLLLRAYEQLKTQTVSIIGLGQPILTAVLGILLLREIPNGWMILGGMIVLLAVYQIIERQETVSQKVES